MKLPLHLTCYGLLLIMHTHYIISPESWIKIYFVVFCSQCYSSVANVVFYTGAGAGAELQLLNYNAAVVHGQHGEQQHGEREEMKIAGEWRERKWRESIILNWLEVYARRSGRVTHALLHLLIRKCEIKKNPINLKKLIKKSKIFLMRRQVQELGIVVVGLYTFVGLLGAPLLS